MKKKITFIIKCLIVLIIASFVVFKLWESGAFLARTADVNSNRVIWNEKEYSPVSGDYTEGRTIAKGKESDWVINAVKEDPSHTFIVVRSFLDQYLMVADDYTIPTSGKLTTVSWNGNYITDASFLEAMSKIATEKSTSFTYETEAIFSLTEDQHMRSLYFAYEDCPVATNFKGYMGKVNGEWAITTFIAQDTRNEDGSPKPHEVSCYRIPEEYWGILEKYFS